MTTAFSFFFFVVVVVVFFKFLFLCLFYFQKFDLKLTRPERKAIPSYPNTYLADFFCLKTN